MKVSEDLELFVPPSDGILALLELLGCLWSWLSGQDLLQLHIQLLLFLSGKKGKKIQPMNKRTVSVPDK